MVDDNKTCDSIAAVSQIVLLRATLYVSDGRMLTAKITLFKLVIITPFLTSYANLITRTMGDVPLAPGHAACCSI